MLPRMFISLVSMVAAAWVSNTPQAPERPQRFTSESRGEQFSVRQRSSVLIPGLGASVEVSLDDITRGQVGLRILTSAGEELVPRQSVSEGSEVAFRIGEENWTIRVERLINRLVGDDCAELIVERSGAGGGLEFDEGGSIPEPSAFEPAEAIRSQVIELIGREMASVDELMTCAVQLLDDGQVAEAREMIQEAKQAEAELRRGLRWTQVFATSSPEAAHCLSLVKVAVVRARPHAERISENGSPEARDWGRFLGRLDSSRQDIEARVLEVHVVGRAYREESVRGMLHPFQLRSDLRPGRSVDLFAERRESGGVIDRSREGRDYWVVITPPEATEAVPRISGGGGPSRILLAIPSRTP